MIRWWLVVAALLFAAPAVADELRPVSIQFEQIDARLWAVSWKQPLAVSGSASGSGSVWGPGVDRGAAPDLPEGCRFTRPPVQRAAALAVIGSAEARCAAPIAGRRIGWPALSGQGDAILRIAPLGRPVQIHRLTVAEPYATVVARPSAAQVWRSYFAIGVEHILSGWDHLLFVIALVLLVGRAGKVIKAATAFTLAHSLTLAAVTFGYAGLPQQLVEALIALSIVFLALEIIRRDRDTLTRRLPWLVAFAFGLLHGFGFAGALREIGLPEGEVPAALVSFNLGVEAGQLPVIAGVFAVLALVRRLQPAATPQGLRLAAYAIGITGSYWLIERLAY